MKTTKLTYATIHDADLDTLTDELAAAGWDSTQTERRDALEAVARLMHETRALGLYDDDRKDARYIRAASVEEAVAYALAGGDRIQVPAERGSANEGRLLNCIVAASW